MSDRSAIFYLKTTIPVTQRDSSLGSLMSWVGYSGWTRHGCDWFGEKQPCQQTDAALSFGVFRFSRIEIWAGDLVPGRAWDVGFGLVRDRDAKVTV